MYLLVYDMIDSHSWHSIFKVLYVFFSNSKTAALDEAFLEPSPNEEEENEVVD